MERMAAEVATLRSVAESGRGGGAAMGAGGWGALPRGFDDRTGDLLLIGASMDIGVLAGELLYDTGNPVALHQHIDIPGLAFIDESRIADQESFHAGIMKGHRGDYHLGMTSRIEALCGSILGVR